MATELHSGTLLYRVKWAVHSATAVGQLQACLGQRPAVPTRSVQQPVGLNAQRHFRPVAQFSGFMEVFFGVPLSAVVKSSEFSEGYSASIFMRRTWFQWLPH